MPYFQQNFEEDKENSPTEVQISGASPTTDSEGKVSTPQTSSGKELSTGSGFQNLDKYITANDPNKIGSQVTGKVQSEIDAAKQNQTIGKQFIDQVQSTQTPTSEQINKAVANPTEMNKEDYQKWMNQTYKGPNSLEDSASLYNDYWAGANKANTSAQLLGTEPGRFSLLESYFGRPNYSFGEKSLDNLMLQKSGAGASQRDLQNQATQLKTQGEAQAKELQNVVSNKKAEIEKSAQAARNAVGVDETGQIIADPNAVGYGAIGRMQAEINAATKASNEARQTSNQELLNNFQTGQLTDQQLSQLGLDRHMKIYNMDLSNPGIAARYLTPGQELTKEMVMTPEQKARINALSSLAGATDTFAQGDLLSKNPEYQFNQNKFKSDAAEIGKDYERQWNAVQQMGPGESPTSYAQLQSFVDMVANSQAGFGRDPNNPATWKGSYADIAKDYINRINAFKAPFQLEHELGGGSRVGSGDNPFIPTGPRRMIRG